MILSYKDKDVPTNLIPYLVLDLTPNLTQELMVDLNTLSWEGLPIAQLSPFPTPKPQIIDFPLGYL